MPPTRTTPTVLEWVNQQGLLFNAATTPVLERNRRFLESFADEFADEQERSKATEIALRWIKALEGQNLTNLQRNPVTRALEQATGEAGFVNEAGPLIDPGLEWLDMEIEGDDRHYLGKLYAFWSDKTTAAMAPTGQGDDDIANLRDLDDMDDDEDVQDDERVDESS